MLAQHVTSDLAVVNMSLIKTKEGVATEEQALTAEQKSVSSIFAAVSELSLCAFAACDL